nr:hypothetical protein [Tanacetum cinerariifolium]
KDIEVGNHEELLSGMTNNMREATMDALVLLWLKNLNVDESLIVQSISIQDKPGSYITVAGGSRPKPSAAGGSKLDPSISKAKFRSLFLENLCEGVYVSIPRRLWKRFSWKMALALSRLKSDVLKESLTIGVHLIEDTRFTINFVSILITVFTPVVPAPNDGFQTLGKKKKGKSKSINGGQIVCIDIRSECGISRIKGDLRFQAMNYVPSNDPTLLLWNFVRVKMSRDVITVGSTMRIPLLYRGEYSQWRKRFMNYLEEQTDGEAMINSIQNGDQPLPVISQVSLAGNAHNAPPTLNDPKFWTCVEKKTRKIDLINDLKKCGYKKDNYELNYKFLNNLQPEWKQYGTLMRQTKNLMDINIDALYNILKQNQGDVNDAL